MASTFTIAKLAVSFMKPFFFIGFRMVSAGALLLGYVYYYQRTKIKIDKKDFFLFFQIIAFHIYCAYIFEFWALQYVSSSKACLLYSLSPFITALLCYFSFGQKLSLQKWIALIIGFIGMIPILVSYSVPELFLSHIGFLSTAEIALLFAIVSAAYGWIVVRKLMDRSYSSLLINGIGMFGGGFLALLTALVMEGINPMQSAAPPHTFMGAFLCMISLIFIANIVGYNLYAYLLQHYSLTFLSLVGLITPVFVSIFGWLFLNERITGAFVISFALTLIGISLFYQKEKE